MRHVLANLMRGAVRCMFPLLAMLVWWALLACDQGADVLRSALEREERLHSVNDLLYLGVGSAVLGLSIWYSMRWLLGAELPALRFTAPVWMPATKWIPRLCGIFPAGLVAFIVLDRGAFPGVDVAVRHRAGVAFVVLVAGLMAFFVKRADLHARLKGAAGRTLDGAPGFLAADSRLPDETRAVIGWSLVFTLLIAIVFVLFNLTAPRVVGAAALAAFSLASINLFGSFMLTWVPMRRRLPPLGPWMVLWAVLISPLTDNHGGTLLPASAGSAQKPLAVEEAFHRWSAGLGDDKPAYVVATEGGGIRAAYWTAAVLQAMARADASFASHVFALSGVSGGAVGASMWTASVRSQLCASGVPSIGLPPPAATDMLSADFVAPALAGLFYYDFAQRFIPLPMTRLDRSRGLEEGMQRAAFRVQGRPFEGSIDDFYAGCDHLPELFLNATVVETGQRAVLTRLSTEGFADVYPMTAQPLATSRQTLAQLTHHSARFTLISPPGSVRQLDDDDGWLEGLYPPVKLRLVDGGYFENSGVLTALDIIHRIAPAAGCPSHPAMPAVACTPPSTDPAFGTPRRVILLVITSDHTVASLCGPELPQALCSAPTASPGQPRPVVVRWMPELLPIVESLANVRDSRLHITATQAVQERRPDVLVRVLPPFDDGLTAPLGWALSDCMRDHMDRAATAVAAQGAAAAPAAAASAATAVTAAKGCKA